MPATEPGCNTGEMELGMHLIIFAVLIERRGLVRKSQQETTNTNPNLNKEGGKNSHLCRVFHTTWAVPCCKLTVSIRRLV